ncbi:hypothetical protein L3i20_v232130 [Paenibacillus sp. L3-i20]|nr:hypothetical protein L3i20_v232130 [Paenibacillus sp. L3-i20]
MKHKYAFLLSMQSIEYEIKKLTLFSKKCSDCFELLQLKLDELCRFMTSEQNEEQWQLWGHHKEIKQQSNQLRHTSTQALCEMEKYQSISTLEKKMDKSDYLTILSSAVKDELNNFRIGASSKVLFVGSGAFPTTALTIAKETSADVLCLDIDREAVDLGRRVAEVFGLQAKVLFSENSLKEQSFLKDATHVIIASLVGNKYEVLEELKKNLNVEAKIMLRYGNGLKSVFNYPLEIDLSEDWDMTPVPHGKSIYDTMIIQSKSRLSVGTVISG